jgi:hypothetical protein
MYNFDKTSESFRVQICSAYLLVIAYCNCFLHCLHLEGFLPLEKGWTPNRKTSLELPQAMADHQLMPATYTPGSFSFNPDP